MELRRRRESDFWRSVNRLLILLIGAGMACVVVLWFIPELRRIEEMRANLAALEREKAEEDLRLRQHEREEKWLNEDPEYVETLARDRLGVMKEGETIFRLDTEMIEAPVQPPPALHSTSPEPGE
jgi:Septum formation initiator